MDNYNSLTKEELIAELVSQNAKLSRLENSVKKSQAINKEDIDAFDFTNMESISDNQINENIYRTIADLNYNWEYWINPNGKFIYVSPSCERITGYSANDFFEDPTLLFSIIHIDDVDKMKTHSHKSHQDFEHESINFRITTKGGEIRWIAHICQTIYNSKGINIGVRGSNRDITNIINAKDELKQSKDFAENLLETANAIIVTLDANANIIIFNKYAESLTGYKKEEVVGKNWFDIFIPEKERVKAVFLNVLNSMPEASQNENVILTKSGEKRIINWRNSILQDSENNTIGILSIGTDVTSHRHAQEQLLDNKERLELALKGTNVGLWDWKVQTGELVLSERWADILGYTLDELSPITINTWKKLAYPDDLKKSDDQLKKHFTKETDYYNCETRMKHKNGSWVWVLDRGKVFEWDKNGNPIRMAGSHLDITQRKNAELELRKSEEKFRSVIKSMNDLLFVLNKDNIFTSVNADTSELYIKPDVFIGKTHSEVMPKFMNDLFAKAIVNVKKGGTEEYEYQLDLPNGVQWFALKISPIFINGKFDGSVSVVRNITERKRIEKEIQLQNIELEQRNEDLDAFSHTVAHDLKNPISNMMGFADLLHDGYKHLTYNEVEKYSSTIIQSGYKTQRIINNLLLFASVSTNNMHIKELNMDKIVSDAMFYFSSELEKTNTQIKLPKSWPSVMGNNIWVTEVLTNYISNAIKYGGSPLQIEIGYNICKPNKYNKPMVRIWVKDNGEGLSVEDQKIVFNKFERLDNADIKGHGLGLSIAKRIVEKLGGEVGLESSRGKGCLFYFTLKSAIGAETANLRRKKHKPISKNSKLKILIAEDEFASNKLLELIVKDISKEMFYAKNGKEAVEVFKNNPDIDLIIMDIRMPIMNGYDATVQVRKLSKDVIIIAHTAFALSNEHERAINAGCNEVIRKPVKRDELLDAIHRLT